MKKIIGAIIVFIAAICGALCLSACSNGKTYSVTCQEVENGYVIVSDKKVEAGEKVILAAKPAAGYKLTELIVDGKTIDGTSFVMPNRDVTVSARFEVITYSVTYVLGDATAVGNNPISYNVENATELVDPQKDGYEVCGWYTYYHELDRELDSDPYNPYDYSFIEQYRVTSLEGRYGNLTLTAHYYNPLHDIKELESDNGWYFVECGGTARYGDTLNVVIDPHAGYELDYIAVNGEPQEGTTIIMPPCDAEVSVLFKPIVYNITYELDGGDNADGNPTTYTVEDGDENGNITFGDAVKDGYIFVGWYYVDEYGYEQRLYNSQLNTYVCSDVTLYAEFYEDYEEYQD